MGLDDVLLLINKATSGTSNGNPYLGNSAGGNSGKIRATSHFAQSLAEEPKMRIKYNIEGKEKGSNLYS